MARAPVYLIEEARARIERMLGQISNWSALTRFLPLDWGMGPRRRTALASMFSAALELARDGRLEMRQMTPFGEIFLKDRATPGSCRRGGRTVNRIIRLSEAQMAEPAEVDIEHAAPAEAENPPALDPMHLRIVEALLFASNEPVDEQTLAKALPGEADIRPLLAELQRHYESRGVNLIKVAGKWQFRTANDLAFLLRKQAVEERKLSRAAIETLAIIAYHQPVTRAEIEDIRGVMVSKGTIDALMEAGWVRIRGRRRTPGRPVTYGTTEAFLTHFGLENVGDLPGMDELKAAGFLDAVPPSSFSVPNPSDALAPDEDPYEGEEEDTLDLLAEPGRSAGKRLARFRSLGRGRGRFSRARGRLTANECIRLRQPLPS